MKTLKLVPLFLIAFLFSTFTAVAQNEDEEEIIEVEEISVISSATFDGIKKGKYIFSYKDEDGDEQTITFDKIVAEIKNKIDLTNKDMIGKKFEVSFTSENETEDDDVISNVKTIVSLKNI